MDNPQPVGSMLCYDYKENLSKSIQKHRRYRRILKGIEEDLKENKPDYVSTTDNAEKGTRP